MDIPFTFKQVNFKCDTYNGSLFSITYTYLLKY